MAVTITQSIRPLDASQVELLRKLFASPEYFLLKEMLASKCIESQVQACSLLVYPDNEIAKNKLLDSTNRAKVINEMLDLLDDIEKNEEKWGIASVEQSQF